MRRFAVALVGLLVVVAASRITRAEPGLAPVLNDDVFVVARLDLDRIDFKALVPWLDAKSALLNYTRQQATDARIQYTKAANDLDGVVNAVRRLGVQRAYLITTLETMDVQMPFVVAFVCDDRTSTQLINGFALIGLKGARVGEAVTVVGQAEAVASFGTFKPAPRRDVAEALRLSRAEPAALLWVPAKPAREMLEQRIPEQHPVIESEIALVTRGVDRAILTLSAPPTFKAQLRVDAADANSADGIETWLNRIADDVRQQDATKGQIAKKLLPQRKGLMFGQSLDDKGLDELLRLWAKK
jgi:hypothetical protein